MMSYEAIITIILVVAFGLGCTEGTCNARIKIANKHPCPTGMRDDGTSCWKDSYGRGVGRIPDKARCPSGTRDDGTSCWLDSYGRGVGRAPDKRPCPSGLRDDGTSCWSDAHIYGKGCCCTLWGCCHKCKSGYHDDGCTCRKTGVGIKVSLFQRQHCKSNEERHGALCYPRCRDEYHPVGCCVCEPKGGPRVVKNLAQRQSCHPDEDKYGMLCYPKCKSGYRPAGCCVCEPKERPGIKVTVFTRSYCTGHSIKFLTFCLEIENCPLLDLIDKFKDMGTILTPENKDQLKKVLTNAGKINI